MTTVKTLLHSRRTYVTYLRNINNFTKEIHKSDRWLKSTFQLRNGVEQPSLREEII